ncbi:ABC-F family ATP-binding cassette domain-containing protein [Paenalkalicoccus suaedae]|uniref:ABC-F family ATP-binding cassette domain-containing protein n=1 Tax=Paenalkalicoccus suaedae TaxID=2592382 RepID=A0A859FBV4_9BACI|nr:ABC-F family ATP-binding cassette domain-containing protein [Paenalkalicoccus suaedae]QKS70211.1 ABC-F family ATP-binding cassette domain-containing protein [Paenalkalicoccus suaedae]
MILLQCAQLSKFFGSEQILSNVKLEIKSRERVALVGRNGAGKSTLLKVIAGEMNYDSGTLMIPKETTIGYLAQDSGLETSRSIWDEMLTVFTEVRNMEKTLRKLEERMSDPMQEDYEKILKEYDQLQLDFQARGGFQYEADIRSILSGLHFTSFDYDTPVESLSGGQKTRLALGKLLLSKPDLLILDEPTNHLDIDTLTWLEGYLSAYDGAVLIVSHDRYFLDKVVGVVYELSFRQTRRFVGNYSSYLDEAAKLEEQEWKLFEKQQGEIKKLEDFVQRNLARASTSNRAKSRRKQLDRMERMDRPRSDDKSAQFSFGITKQTGNDVMKIDSLSLGYTDEALVTNLSLDLSRGESLALIGPNGIGKSTLLKAIVKKLKPLAGSIHYGSNVEIGYYDQEQTELHSSKTVLQELWDDYPQTPEKDIRTVLGNFLFSGDDVLKNVQDLSGGEKARLALSKLMMQKANVLILDEPTNHLDLDSKEVLEEALISYPGTIIFVSHDRYFVNRMATRVAELSPTGVTSYLGDYDYYVQKKLEQAELKRLAEEENKPAVSDVQATPSSKSDYQENKAKQKNERQRKRRIEELENAIEQKETVIEELEAKLVDPEVFADHEKAREVNEQLEAAKAEMDEAFEEWEALQ